MTWPRRPACCPRTPPRRRSPTVFRSPRPEAPQRLLIPRLRVDAPVVTFTLDQLEKDGSLPAPKKANDVAWYDYSGRAGEANNVVLSGHVDWRRQRRRLRPDQGAGQRGRGGAGRPGRDALRLRGAGL